MNLPERRLGNPFICPLAAGYDERLRSTGGSIAVPQDPVADLHAAPDFSEPALVHQSRQRSASPPGHFRRGPKVADHAVCT
jgi:hypothetical protein